MKKVTKILAAMVLFLFMAGSAHAGWWVKDLKMSMMQQYGSTTTVFMKDSGDVERKWNVYGDGSTDSKKMITAMAMMAYAEEDRVDVFVDKRGLLLIRLVK